MIDPKLVCATVQGHAEVLQCNFKTLDILEGNLEPYVIKSLERQLSPKAMKYARERVVPINIMPRYVEKLSNIYQTGVLRSVQYGSTEDDNLLSWYVEKTNVNSVMHIANRLFNACQSTLIYPYVMDGLPQLRVIPNDRFVVYSDDPYNRLQPTMVIILAGIDAQNRQIYWVYDKDQFLVVKSDETVDVQAMTELGNPDGVNRYGVLPFVYVNSSSLRLCPVPDRDTIRMTEFIPMALTDLNVASMFSSFSITHVTNGRIENLNYSPNALWFLKSDDPEKDVEIGTLKPEVDYQEVLNLIQSELSLFLGSKGIKSQTVGALTQDSYASGIAKIIDEADTFDVRQAQTLYFQKAEKDLWNLIFHSMQPIWAQYGEIEYRYIPTSTAQVETKFSVIPVGTQRSQIINDQREEFAAGFTTRKRAIMMLNPQLSVSQVEELITEIDLERGFDNGNQVAANNNQAP
jgi:hypothetical protein